MGFVLVLIFSAIAITALAFVCWPLWRHTDKGQLLLVGSLAAFVLAIAAGTYVFVGHPHMALRAIEDPKRSDRLALVSKLAWRMRQQPDDPRGWLLLARAYSALGDANDSALAYKRAIATAPSEIRPLMWSQYGMTLTAAAGAVTSDAEAAFRNALAHNPKDFVARFYLGEAFAERRDKAHALAMWQGLLADTPQNAPWRGPLLDRIALLERSSGQAPPDVSAMVQGLADRLKAQPNDPAGWQRLLKAYVVLGETAKAREALSNARKALASDHADLAAIDAEARALHLEN
jgi:cytochrome c-type biogenesis protein CcmH